MKLPSTYFTFTIFLVQFLIGQGFEGARTVPLQMDVGASKHITICTGLSRSISCRDGSNIAITYAFWGRTSDKICPSDDGDPVTDCETAEETEGLVKGYCEGKEQCMLEAKHTYLQRNETRHCPGVNKYLIVNYTCIPESKGVVLCDSEETTIECNAGWKIEVTDAFWGRRVSAKYCGTGDSGMECESTDSAIKILKSQCDGSTSCRIQANNEKFDDKRNNCPGLLKYLLVNYGCRPKDGRSKQSKGSDDENETAVESKLLADTSSKELMGLLEKHLNELQAKPAKSKSDNKAEASKSDPEDKRADSGQKMPSAAKASKEPKMTPATSTATKQGKTSKKTTHIVPVDSDIGKYTSGPLSARSLGKSLDNDGNESPAMDLQETESSKKNQEKVPNEVTAAVKQEVPKATVETTEDSYEVTEPATVKSILARAKEVLKTLDDDKDDLPSSADSSGAQGQSANVSTKKSDIERKAKKEEERDNEIDVKQMAKLARSLVKTAGKTSLPSSSSIKAHGAENGSQALSATAKRVDRKPLPGPQKSGLKATGPGTAGIGNTP